MVNIKLTPMGESWLYKYARQQFEECSNRLSFQTIVGLDDTTISSLRTRKNYLLTVIKQMEVVCKN